MVQQLREVTFTDIRTERNDSIVVATLVNANGEKDLPRLLEDYPTATTIVVNLSGIPSIDSDALGCLLTLKRQVGEAGRSPIFCHVQSGVMAALQVLNIPTVFDIREQVSDCL